MRQIQRNKISDTFVKSVNGLLKEVHLSVHASVQQLQCVRRIGVSVLVPKDSSAFTEAIVSGKVKAIVLYREYEDKISVSHL